MKPKTRWLAYVVSLAVSLALSAGVLMVRRFPELTDYYERMAALSDGFFVPGVLLGGIALLVFVADDGFFDIFRFGFQRMLSVFRLRRKEPGEDGPQTFYEYRLAKHGEKKASVRHLFVVAGLDLVLASVFLLLHLS